MNDQNETCPQCESLYGYYDGVVWVCPECNHEWQLTQRPSEELESEVVQFLDANGVQLSSGDTVRVIKDLKVGKDTLKSGTKVKGIRLLDTPVNDHDISCRVDGFGAIYLKCSVVRKDN